MGINMTNSWGQVTDNTKQLAEMSNQGQIAGFKVVTQVEYDALPASKLTDDVIYLIKG